MEKAGQIEAPIDSNEFQQLYIPSRLRPFAANLSDSNILGGNRTNALHLNKSTLHDVVSNIAVLHVDPEVKNSNQGLNYYKHIFKIELGSCMLKDLLYIGSNTIPKFHKLRFILFTYRRVVETDLKNLIKEGAIIELINISKLAAPTLVVTKLGG
ncbi:unnamed protein product [Rotaria sp. Silwood2]|nr:unnamed protein product [Rotaria sp. Silwood2]CAF3069057.1 unnamed protein product [Rotaria sp. Silwood2]CAF4180489.1 unnamed protein product [Rotaria sp. Silwood2]CAF4273643.1 unnamed protein product [Rotaria sp. Silwood2]